MKSVKKKVFIVLCVILFAALYYYFALPALNIHSTDIWVFVFGVLALSALIYFKRHNLDRSTLRQSKGFRGFVIAIVAVFVIYGAGMVLSSPVVNAKRYYNLLTVEEGTFEDDIEELPFDRIPLLDRNSAVILGNRKMGSMLELVSQFEVDNLYSQINHQDRPVRVTPLHYANIIKWFTNMRNGIPAYIKIDMSTQTTHLVKMSEGMKYTTSDHFGRYIYRHLRFHYPTYIFDDLSFEIDDNGVPYWICPVKKFNIGLFGGVTIGRVVLCNAITGELQNFRIDEVPEWVDRAYSADLLVQLFDYHGKLKHGFFNSILGQRDCRRATSGYNFLAIDDDVWVYTGVTSITGDQSNIGFVLMNSRTMETKFYKVEGATEESAMMSAEGQVQNLKYHAAFPLLLNISGEPTYFIALKDDAGLVKKYAMVNVQKYQIVAIGNTVSECKSAYNNLMYQSGIKKVAADTREVDKIKGRITKIAQAVIGGDSYFFIMIEGCDDIFEIPFTAYLDIIKYDIGDTLTIEYRKGDETDEVLSVNGTKLTRGNMAEALETP